MRTLSTALIALLYFTSSSVWASGPALTYHGRLLHADGTSVTSTAVQFRIQVRSPGTENCLLYEETQTKDLSSTAGVFVLGLNDGSGTRSDGSGISFSKIFNNNSPFSFGAGLCSSGTTYTPATVDGRALAISFNDGTFSGWEAAPVQAVNYAPKSLDSLQVGGFTSSSLVRVADTSGPQPASALTPANFTELLSLLGGTSAQYMKSSSTNGTSLPNLSVAPSSPAAGQVWYDSGSNVIKYYNGTSVQTLGAAGAGISSLTVGTSMTAGGVTGGTLSGPGTIDLLDSGVTAGAYTKVTVDVKGRVTAGAVLAETDIPTLSAAGKVSGSAITTGTIAGNTAISTTGSISATGANLRTLTLTNGSTQSMTLAPASSITGSPTLTLPGTAGANGQILQTDGTGILSWKNIEIGDLKSSVSGSLFSSPNCAANQTLTWTSGTDQFSCISIGSLNASSVTAGAFPSAQIPSLDWAKITTGLPTTLAGYGVTDGVKNTGSAPSIQSGADASKPASPAGGAIYFATDTKVIYQFNAGAWAVIASASGAGGTITALTSDVSASGMGSVAATVNTVGSSTAANIHAAEVLANAATNANTADTLVKRDPSGNFTAGTITANLTGPASSNVLKTGDSMSGNLSFSSGKGVVLTDSSTNTVSLQAPTTVTSYVLKMPPAVATSTGQVLTSDTSGNLTWASALANIAVTSPITNAGSASAPNIAIQVANTSQSGYLSSADWNTFSGKQTSTLTSGQIWVGNASNVPVGLAPGGDLTATNAGAFTLAKIQGTTVNTTTPSAAGQVLRYSSSQYIPAFLGVADLRSSVSPFGGIFASAACTSSQSLYYQSSTDTFQCQSIAVADASITYASKTANTFLAAPNGSGGAPAFRTIASADLPSGIATTGTYNSVTVDTYGRVTAGTNPTTLAGYGITNGVINDGQTGAITAGPSDTNSFTLQTAGTSRMTILSGGSVGIGNAAPAGLLDVSKSLSQAVSSTTGAYLSLAASTLTDSTTTTTATGAIFNSIAAPTLAATNTGVTTTKTSTFYVGGAPKSGTNETLTNTTGIYVDTTAVNPTGTAANSYGLYVNAQSGATKNYAATFMGGNVGIGTASPTAILDVTGTFNLNGNMNIQAGTMFKALVSSTNQGFDINSATANVFMIPGTMGLTSYHPLNVAGDSGIIYGGTAKAVAAAVGMGFVIAPWTSLAGGGIRMDGSGNVGIGISAPSYPLDVAGDIRTSTCIRTSAGIASGVCTSDERLKTDFHDFILGLEALQGIHPKYYRYNGLGGQPAGDTLELGVVAQDVEKTAPELISTKSVLLHPSDETKTEIKTVNYTGLLYVVINSVQELYRSLGDLQKQQSRELASVKLENDLLKLRLEKMDREATQIKERLEKLESRP
jgi:hypothetical protein